MKKSISILGFCLDLRVIGALALVAGATFVLAPQFFWTALPVLAILACPISMVLMMRGMNNKNAQGRTQGLQVDPDDPVASRNTIGPRSREEQLRDLQDQLDRVQGQQAALASQIRQLGGDRQPASARAKAELGPN